MLAPHVVGIISIGALIVVGAGSLSGQNYPYKPIRVVNSEIGGGSDFMTRIIAQGISPPLGQPLVIENRASRLTSEIVVKFSKTESLLLNLIVLVEPNKRLDVFPDFRMFIDMLRWMSSLQIGLHGIPHGCNCGK